MTATSPTTRTADRPIVIVLRVELPREALKWAEYHNGNRTVGNLRSILHAHISALVEDLQYDYETKEDL